MKLNRLQKIIVSVLAFFLGIGIILRCVGGSLASNWGYDVFSMLKYALIDHPIKTLKDWTSDLATLWKVHEENEQLRYELSQAPASRAELEDLKRENTELREALKLKNKQEYTSVEAEVISRSPSTWNNQLIINKGRADGITEGMAVESVKGMVGKIESMTSHTSVVKLLTSEDKKANASVRINVNEKHSSEGILSSYDVEKGQYIVYLYEDSDDIEAGMQVVTSGKGGVYPSGLLIGTVESVQALSNQVGLTIYVKPVDDMQEFSIVRVIGQIEEE